MALKSLAPRISTVKRPTPIATATGTWRNGITSSTARGYGYRWQQARAVFLQQHPLCQCPACDEGRVHATLATVVDHKIPHNGNPELFWDPSNWQALSKKCHDTWKAQLERKAGQRA